MYHNIKYTNL